MKIDKRVFIVFFISSYACFLMSCNSDSSKAAFDPSPVKTPVEELSTFQLEPGLKIQLVASEPMVQDPVVIRFDEDGRMWVVEMRGFMPDIDGNGERERVGRISVLEDTNADGVMDASTIYMDSLVMPRALALVQGGALVVERESLWLTQDSNHDLKADTKILIDADYAGSKLPEHSGNGLLLSLDNWYYNAKSRFRYRLINGSWTRDSTEFRGQWGMSHDDEGRLYYNYNWSQLHADLVPPNYLSRNKNHTPTTGIDYGLTIDRRVYPIRETPAVNRGYIPGTLDEAGKLVEFTAACSPFFYRGATLPSSFYGNVFVCEPSGNLVKRNVVEENGLLLSAHDPHPGKEFLASTDERFRPTFIATGPDGALYVADMYRGLIQHEAYVTPYLRDQTLSRKLAQPIHYGRIWRIVPEDWKPTKTKKLSSASTEELIGYLSNQNGWYRDMAQKILVERKDRTIKESLIKVIKKGDNLFGRLHAFWTLEGLDLLDTELLFKCMLDETPLIRITCLRLLEPFAKADLDVQAKLQEMILSFWQKASPKEILQISLTANVFDQKHKQQTLGGIIQRYDTSALIRDAVMSSLQDQEFVFLQTLRKSSGYKTNTAGKEIFLEMLTTAIIKKGHPVELSNLLEMLNVKPKHFEWEEKTLLTALSIQGRNRKAKPIQLKSEPKIFIRTDLPVEPSQLQTLSAMFEWPGHKVDIEAKQTSQLTDEDQKQFALGRQHFLTTCAGCHGTNGAGMNHLAPTLIGSDWVLGNEKRLALIILHGLEGPIEVAGKGYDIPEILPVMPAHSTMDDGAITAIMMYIRNEWGNNAGPVSKRVVGSTRHTSQGRVVPWTAGELNKHMIDTITNTSP